MNNPILFISREQLTTYSPVSFTFEVDKMVPAILQAQADYRKVLTPDLYLALSDAIKDHMDDIAVPIPDRFIALMDAMAQSLSLRAVYYSLPSLWLQISQKGLTAEASENSRSASKSELIYLRDDLNSNWTTTLSIFIEWLNENRALYPEYKSVGSKPDAPYNPILFY